MAFVKISYNIKVIKNWFWFKFSDLQGSLYPSNQGEWILGNVHQYGFYRVNYDPANWKALMNQLKQQHTVSTQI